LEDVSLVSDLACIAQEVEYGQDLDVEELSAAARKGIGRTDLPTSGAVQFEDDGDEASVRGEAIESTNEPASESKKIGVHMLEKSSSGNYRIQDALDRWEEPTNKSDKEEDIVSIGEVVRFRRLLLSTDETKLFGEGFGPAGDRSECIASAHTLYWRLLALSPGAS